MNKFQTFIIRSVSPVKKYARLCMKTSIKTFAELAEMFNSTLIQESKPAPITPVRIGRKPLTPEQYRELYPTGYKTKNIFCGNSCFNDASTKCKNLSYNEIINLVNRQSETLITKQVIKDHMDSGIPFDANIKGLICSFYFERKYQSKITVHKMYRII